MKQRPLTCREWNPAIASSRMVFIMEPRISLITLGVSVLERAVRFYRDGLGLPMRDDFEAIAFFKTRGTWLALYPREALAADAKQAPEGEGFQGFTLAHNDLLCASISDGYSVHGKVYPMCPGRECVGGDMSLLGNHVDCDEIAKHEEYPIHIVLVE